jgi:hypothetical protein
MASNPYQSPSASDAVSGKRKSWVLITLGVVGAIVVLVPLVLCFGVLTLIMAEGRAYHQRYLREKAEIVPILTSDPAFKDLEERERSDGGAYIRGRVESNEDVETLRRRLSSRLGEKRGDELVKSVYTREMEDAWNKELK